MLDFLRLQYSGAKKSGLILVGKSKNECMIPYDNDAFKTENPNIKSTFLKLMYKHF